MIGIITAALFPDSVEFPQRSGQSERWTPGISPSPWRFLLPLETGKDLPRFYGHQQTPPGSVVANLTPSPV